MSELTCKVSNCTYNKDTACCKGDIMVGGKNACESDSTCCESFHQRKGEQPPSSAVSHPSHTISIDCEAVKCQHNTDYRCDSEHVDINGKNACTCGETVCATFVER